MSLFRLSHRIAQAGLTLSGLLIAPLVLAGSTNPDPLEGVNITANRGGIITRGDLPSLTGRVIGSLLTILGTIFLVLIIYGGFLWMTAAGNEDKVRRAKSIIITSFVGLAIIFLAYAITALIGSLLSTA